MYTFQAFQGYYVFFFIQLRHCVYTIIFLERFILPYINNENGISFSRFSHENCRNFLPVFFFGKGKCEFHKLSPSLLVFFGFSELGVAFQHHAHVLFYDIFFYFYRFDIFEAEKRRKPKWKDGNFENDEIFSLFRKLEALKVLEEWRVRKFSRKLSFLLFPSR
jgi:hypothetical protein